MLLILTPTAVTAEALPFAHYSAVQITPAPVRVSHRSAIWIERAQAVPLDHYSAVEITRVAVPLAHYSGVRVLANAHPQAAWPAPRLLIGQRPGRWMLSCELGTALSGSITLEESRQVAELEFDGHHSPYTFGGPDAPVTFTLALAGTTLATSVTLHVDEQHEVKEDGGRLRTHMRFRNKYAEAVNGKALDELVTWHVSPRPPQREGAALKPRSMGVMEVLRKAFAEAGVGRLSVQGPDAFRQARWEEGLRDYSTKGKTARQIFDDSYGLLGYTLVIRGASAYVVAAGSQVGQGSVSRCAMLGYSEAVARAHVPSLLRLTAPDMQDKGPLAIPEPEEITQYRESDYSPENKSRTETLTTFRGDQLLEKTSITWGTVRVVEQIGGEEVVKEFWDVLIGGETTSNTYHPENPQALIRESTRRIEVGYSLSTQPQSISFGGLYKSVSALGGDLLRDETDVRLTSWYTHADGKLKAGYAKRVTSHQRRLKEVQQQGAEADPKERGPLEARGYTTLTTVENYLSPNGIHWTQEYSESGGGNVPLYDKESGEPVRLVERAGSLKTAQRGGVTPPRVAWPDPEAPKPTYPVPVRAEWKVDGGRGGELEQHLPMLKDGGGMNGLAELLIKAHAPRRDITRQLAHPPTARPGDQLNGDYLVSVQINVGAGRVTGVSVSARRSEEVSLSLLPPAPATRGVVTGFYKVAGVVRTVKVALPTYPAGGGVPETEWKEDYLVAPAEPPALGSMVDVLLTPEGQLVIKGA